MKHIIIISILFLSYSCKDQFTNEGPRIKEVRTPTACPPDGPYPEPPNTNFDGIKSITNITANQVSVNWNMDPKAKAYMILMKSSNEDWKLIHTRNAPSTSANIKNLEANTTYEFKVKLIDERGLPDLNDKYLSATTTAWPEFNNNLSLNFNASKSLQLISSNDIFNNNTFTISSWIKSDQRIFSDLRIITLHHTNLASSSIFLALNENHVVLGYRNKQGQLRERKINFNYYNSKWHHVALTYNNNFYVVYINGENHLQISDSFIGFGSHHAHIASYTGTQRGFVGLIDEVSLWDSALSFNDIEMLYNNGETFNLNLHSRAQMNLRHWYRMGDDPRDNTSLIYDQIGEANAIGINLVQDDFKSDTP